MALTLSVWEITIPMPLGERCEQEVSILFPEQPSAPFEHLIWHVLRPYSFSPARKDVKKKKKKRKKNPTEVTPASFRDQRHPPTVLEWIIDSYFSSPRVFGSLFLFARVHKTGSMFLKGIELFVAAIRYLPVHVNLRGYWEAPLSFVSEFEKRFRFQRLFSARHYANEVRVDFCIAPSFQFFLFASCALYKISERLQRRDRHFDGFTAKTLCKLALPDFCLLV